MLLFLSGFAVGAAISIAFFLVRRVRKNSKAVENAEFIEFINY